MDCRSILREKDVDGRLLVRICTDLVTNPESKTSDSRRVLLKSCPKRDSIPVIQTTVKHLLVTKKLTSTVLKTVYTSTRTVTRATGGAATPVRRSQMLVAEKDTVSASSDLGSLELANPEPQQKANKETIIALARRNLCPRCPPDSLLSTSGSPCCPARKTITKTRTRFSTSMVKVTTVRTIRAVATKVVFGRVQDVTGRLYFDLDAVGFS